MKESDIARELFGRAMRNYLNWNELTIRVKRSPSSRDPFRIEIIIPPFPREPAPGRVRTSPSSRLAKPKADPVATAEAEVQSLSLQLDCARQRLVEARKSRNLIKAESRHQG